VLRRRFEVCSVLLGGALSLQNSSATLRPSDLALTVPLMKLPPDVPSFSGWIFIETLSPALIDLFVQP
jgi:hypothetical protein